MGTKEFLIALSQIPLSKTRWLLPQTARRFSLSASTGERAGARCRNQLLVNTGDERGLSRRNEVKAELTLINFRRTLAASVKSQNDQITI